MNQINGQVWRRFVKIAKPYWFSEDKAAARTLLFVLLLFMLAVNGLNVVINYVGGDFMTALSSKNAPKYYQLLWIYASVFVVGTPIVVFNSWFQNKLGIRWRAWLTEHLLGKYLQNRAFYKLNHLADIDNPDERLHQDVNSFTSSALSFTLVLLGSLVTLFSFAGILWSIYKPLCVVLILYSVGGTIATVWFGKRLIGLNFSQLRKEADFRYSLVHVRKNVESIAFYQGEEQESFQIKRRFQDVVSNFNLLIGWQRNLGFLTTGYNYLVVIIPALVISPLYFAGKVQFGVITQAEMAFTQVLASLSVIVTSFSELSAFIAVINRLGSFVEALESCSPEPDSINSLSTKEPQAAPPPSVEIIVAADVQFANLAVTTPNGKTVLVRDLDLALAADTSLIVVGASGTGKSSLVRTLAGLWQYGWGSITRPALSSMLFLPQKPYSSLGSLRSQLLYPHAHLDINEEELQSALDKVNLPDLSQKVGGFEAEADWGELLSLGEQQRLAFARVLIHRPRFVVLDEATSALDANNEARLYELLKASGCRYISVGHRSSLLQYHNMALELKGDSTWEMKRIELRRSLQEYPEFFSLEAVAQANVIG